MAKFFGFTWQRWLKFSLDAIRTSNLQHNNLKPNVTTSRTIMSQITYILF